MEITIKLIALLLAFACYADANAYEIKESDGTYWRIHTQTVKTEGRFTTAVAYVSGANDYANLAVQDCRVGRGIMYAVLNGKGRTFDWHAKGEDTIDQIALATCTSAFVKGQLK